MPRGVIVTYSRRHQLRQVKAEKNDSWGSVIGKSKEDHIFGSSFSSGLDSSSKLSDNSIELREKKPAKRSRRYEESKNKENVRRTYQRRGPTKKRENMFSLSDGMENTSGELENSGNKQKPLREQDVNTRAKGRPTKERATKRVNKKRKTEQDYSKDIESSIEHERRDVNVRNQFAEFEEFSLCIEEEKAEENDIVIKVPPNITPSSSSCSSVASVLRHTESHSPQMHTSTPQMQRKPVENLFRRLTRSNLKKMSSSGTGTPLSGVAYPVSKSSTPGYETEGVLAISPACSHISRRESFDSEMGNTNMNDTLESIVNISASISHQVNTRRRTRVQARHIDLLGMSGIDSPSLHVFTPISASGRQIHHISEQSEYDISQEDNRVVEVVDEEEEGEEDVEYHEQASLEEIEAATDFADKINQLHISYTEDLTDALRHERSYNIYHDCVLDPENGHKNSPGFVGQVEGTNAAGASANKDYIYEEKISDKEEERKKQENKHTPIRGCDIVLERLSESLVSQLTSSGTSVNVKSIISEYDASQSLFDDYDLSKATGLTEDERSSVYQTAEEEMLEPSVSQNLHQRGYHSSEDDHQSVGSCDGTSEDCDSNSDMAECCEQSHFRAMSVIEELNESCRSFQCLTPVRSRSSGRVLPPSTKVLALCGQEEPLTFTEFIPQAMMRKCTKIGEGVYGEVFRSQTRKSSIALKIIPIEGDFPVNDEPQKTFAEVLPEILTSQNLSELSCGDLNATPNFVQLNRCGIVQGSYPDHLKKEWDRYHAKKVSENDRPDMFPKSQLFLVFDFEDSGSDLEGFEFQSLHEARSVLLQVALSLAVAEIAIEFEHRDLHWGNVLIKRTDEEVLNYTFEGIPMEIETHSVKAAVIDFTLSRIKKDGVTAFNNLALDPTMFEGQGDYQFDVYRRMRDETENNWEPFHPYTNVLWLHYLADKLFNHKSFPKNTSKEHKILTRQFRTLIREMTDYNSAVHLITGCPFFTE